MTASSAGNAGTPAAAAVDGDAGTRWSSDFSDPQWVDLGAPASISQVVPRWQAAHAAAFQLDLMVTRVLTPMFAFGLFDRAPT